MQNHPEHSLEIVHSEVTVKFSLELPSSSAFSSSIINSSISVDLAKAEILEAISEAGARFFSALNRISLPAPDSGDAASVHFEIDALLCDGSNYCISSTLSFVGCEVVGAGEDIPAELAKLSMAVFQRFESALDDLHIGYCDN